MTQQQQIGVFRFFNYEKSRYGESFGLCRKHEQAEKDNPPPFITKGMGFMEKISESGSLACNECDLEGEEIA